jgi:hypothetical protein
MAFNKNMRDQTGAPILILHESPLAMRDVEATVIALAYPNTPRQHVRYYQADGTHAREIEDYRLVDYDTGPVASFIQTTSIDLCGALRTLWERPELRQSAVDSIHVLTQLNKADIRHYLEGLWGNA